MISHLGFSQSIMGFLGGYQSLSGALIDQNALRFSQMQYSLLCLISCTINRIRKEENNKKKGSNWGKDDRTAESDFMPEPFFMWKLSLQPVKCHCKLYCTWKFWTFLLSWTPRRVPKSAAANSLVKSSAP